MMMTQSLHRSRVRFLALFTVLSLLGAAAVQAQQYKYKVAGEEPELDSLLSPQLAGGKDFRPKEWLEVEAKLFLQMAPEPKSKTCDRLTIRWYVAVANPEQRGTFLLFSREVKHVNIPVGEEIYCSIYMSPASIRRLLGEARNPEKAVEVVSYEVLIDGEVLAYQTSNRKFSHEWWTKGGDKLIRSEVVPLLDKSQTPFSIMWWDRYAEVDPKDEEKP